MILPNLAYLWRTYGVLLACVVREKAVILQRILKDRYK